MLRSKILQMRLEHPEQKIDIVCGLRNFENPFVTLFALHGGFVLARICEGDSQCQFLCDEINCCQTHRELLQKTAQHEKQRLGCFDFALKLETLMERLRRSNQFEQSTGSSIGTLPHADCFGAKSRPQLLLIQRRKLAQRMDSPFVQDGEDFLHLHLPFHADNLQQEIRYVQVNIQAFFFFHSAPPNSGRTNRFARMSMIRPASTTTPKRCVAGKSESTKMANPAAKITSE